MSNIFIRRHIKEREINHQMLINLYNKANSPTLWAYISTSPKLQRLLKPPKKFEIRRQTTYVVGKRDHKGLSHNCLHIQEHQNKVYTMKNLYNALILTAYNTRTTEQFMRSSLLILLPAIPISYSNIYITYFYDFPTIGDGLRYVMVLPDTFCRPCLHD